MTDLNETAASFDLFSKVLFVVDYNEEEIRHRAVETAAAEADCARGVSAKNVKLFCDRTGNYAEVTLPGSYEYTCGMKLCCIVDTDTMGVRGVCPVEELGY